MLQQVNFSWLCSVFVTWEHNIGNILPLCLHLHTWTRSDSSQDCTHACISFYMCHVCAFLYLWSCWQNLNDKKANLWKDEVTLRSTKNENVTLGLNYRIWNYCRVGGWIYSIYSSNILPQCWEAVWFHYCSSRSKNPPWSLSETQEPLKWKRQKEKQTREENEGERWGAAFCSETHLSWIVSVSAVERGDVEAVRVCECLYGVLERKAKKKTNNKKQNKRNTKVQFLREADQTK